MTVYMKNKSNGKLIKFLDIDKVLVSHHTIYTMWLLISGEVRESYTSDEYELVEFNDLLLDAEKVKSICDYCVTGEEHPAVCFHCQAKLKSKSNRAYGIAAEKGEEDD